MSDETESVPRIVVGTDGSDPAKAAVRWAVRQAQLTGAVVDAVISWEYPALWAGWTPSATDVFDWPDTASKVLNQTLEEVVASDPAFAAVKIRPVVVQGNAAAALLDIAEGADLLVVGNRGHGGFARAVLGSVSQHVTQQATCPVVVVRPPKSS